MHIDKMSEVDFAALLGSVDDSEGHHILWVTKTGDVRISAIGSLTPVGWAQKHAQELQFRRETFNAGNDYCGEKAAADKEYVKRLLAELRQDWKSGRTGYLDY